MTTGTLQFRIGGKYYRAVQVGGDYSRGENPDGSYDFWFDVEGYPLKLAAENTTDEAFYASKSWHRSAKEPTSGEILAILAKLNAADGLDLYGKPLTA